MFGIGSSIKAIIALCFLLLFVLGFWYISGLRADLAIAHENTAKLQTAVEQQQEAMTQLKEDQEKIRASTAKLNETIQAGNKEVTDLRNKFEKDAAGKKRDFGKAAAEKPTVIERAVNRGTISALRCLEIASGSPLTEAEKNATKPNEINKECTSLANPNFKP